MDQSHNEPDNFSIDEDDAQIVDEDEGEHKDDETAGDEGVDDGYKP